MNTHYVALYDTPERAEQTRYALLAYVNREDISILHKTGVPLFDAEGTTSPTEKGLALLAVDMRNPALQAPVIQTLFQHGALEVRLANDGYTI